MLPFTMYYKLLELYNLDNIFNIKIASLVYKLKYHPSNSPAAPHKLIAPSSPQFVTIIILDMPQKRIYTDQCPELIMAFQDSHLWPPEFEKKYLTV